MSQSKKKLGPFNMILYAIAALYIVSFIIPSGTFERAGDLVNIDNFTYLPKQVAWPWEIAFEIGSSAAEQFGPLWINMISSAGLVSILTQTKALNRTIGALVKRLEDRAYLLIPIFTLFMFLTTLVGIFVNSALALIPIGLLISRELKVDYIFAFAIVFVPAWVASWFSGVDPVAMTITQQAVGVEVFSGAGFRMAVGFIAYLICLVYLMTYAKRVATDPKNSVIADFQGFDEESLASETDVNASFREILASSVFVIGILVFLLGVVYLDFGVNHFTGAMFLATFVVAIILKLNVTETMDYYLQGARGMMTPVIILTMSQIISLILSHTQITDTIIYWLSKPLIPLSGIPGAIGIFIINALINIVIFALIPQLVIVMPIMAPLAQALSVSPQATVLATMYGAGITDFLTPFNGIMMAGLALVEVDFKDWIKFYLPLVSLLAALMIGSIVTAMVIGL